MEILHSGFDKLELAFTGSLSTRHRKTLAEAKARAVSEGESAHVVLAGMDIWVKETGAKGGYAFVFDMGPDTVMWAVKDNGNPANWNFRAVVSSLMCAVDGWHGVKGHLLDTLKAWRTHTMDVSISRIDYAVDFVSETFAPCAESVLCHSNSSLDEFRDGDFEALTDKQGLGTRFHYRNRKVSGITVGKMPGRQVVIYDKTREIVMTKKKIWREIWSREVEKGERVWRIEVRAGKDHLSLVKIKTFEDVERAIGTLFHTAMKKIRLLVNTDISNISRAEELPEWKAVRKIVGNCIEDATESIDFTRVVEGQRAEIAEIYRKQIMGCAFGYAVTKGFTLRETIDRIGQELKDDIKNFASYEATEFKRKFKRASDRLKFIETPEHEDKGYDPNEHWQDDEGGKNPFWRHFQGEGYSEALNTI